MEFGARLSALRKSRGLSQESLAEQMEVSRQAVSKWELGDAQPELGNLEKLCRLLEVSPNELLGYERDGEDSPPPAAKPRRWWLPLPIVIVAALLVGLCIGGATLSDTEGPDQALAERALELSGYETQPEFLEPNILALDIVFAPSLSDPDFTYWVGAYTPSGESYRFAAELEGGICHARVSFPYAVSLEYIIAVTVEAEGLTYTKMIERIYNITDHSYNNEFLDG